MKSNALARTLALSLAAFAALSASRAFAVSDDVSPGDARVARVARVAVSAGDRRAAPGFKVSFHSIGTGINTLALLELKGLILDQFPSKNLKDYRISSWGREGERTICFVLKAPGSALELLQAFQASDSVQGDDRISYESTASCKD